MNPTSWRGSVPFSSTVPQCETAVPGNARPSRNAVPPGDTADVWWFDTRAVAVTPAGLAGLDRGERSRAEAFLFPADRRRARPAGAGPRALPPLRRGGQARPAAGTGRAPGPLVLARALG